MLLYASKGTQHHMYIKDLLLINNSRFRPMPAAEVVNTRILFCTQHVIRTHSSQQAVLGFAIEERVSTVSSSSVLYGSVLSVIPINEPVERYQDVCCHASN
jgi:hypothetical protein